MHREGLHSEETADSELGVPRSSESEHALAKSWDELVTDGRRVVADHNWHLGELALEVETNYGGQQLARFAMAIEVEPDTLKVYRWVAARWPRVNRITDLPWTAHQVLAAQDDRFELIKTIGRVSDARAVIRDRGTRSRTADDEDRNDDFPGDDPVPSFEPIPDDEQYRLDGHRSSITCPSCGHSWDAS